MGRRQRASPGLGTGGGNHALAGDARTVQAALGRLRPPTAAGHQAVAALRRYVHTHAHRLRYGELREHGYAVASANATT